jgi:hypothetical protein
MPSSLLRSTGLPLCFSIVCECVLHCATANNASVQKARVHSDPCCSGWAGFIKGMFHMNSHVSVWVCEHVLWFISMLSCIPSRPGCHCCLSLMPCPSAVRWLCMLATFTRLWCFRQWMKVRSWNSRSVQTGYANTYLFANDPPRLRLISIW